MELYYDGKKIDGKLICYDSSYVSLRDYKYSAHIEKGNISIKSDILIFTSQYDGFESTDGAEVSIEIRETWQIYSECFSSFSITHKEISENPSSFTADFSDESQWSGLTEYLKYGKNGDFFGNNRGWDNKTGAIRSIADYDFGNEINMEFSLFTSYRNASYTENRDYYVSVGGLKIEICNFQTAVNVYYNGKKADGDIVYKSEPVYPDNGKYDFNYTVDISGNIIVLESELLKFEARLEDFGGINDSKVYVGISETWHIYEGYFGYLRINAEKEKYENGGDILYTRFENTDLWQKSEMSELINTVKQVFPKDYGWDNKTGRLSTEKVYDFSSEYTAFFGLNTYNLNESYKNDFEENKNSTDYRLNIGSISVEINYFQNGISVSKDGFRLKSVLSDKISYDSKEYDYAVTVSAGKITVSQLKGDRELLKLECGLGDSSAADDVFVSLEVCETWQIYDGNFSYLIVADKSHGIKNARSFFDGIDSQKYDWTQDAFGGGEFSSDFTDKTFWIGNITEYIDTENKKFAPDYGWENKTGEITTAKWYNFGPDFKMEFKLFTSYINDANKNSALEEKYKFADYSVGVGKFRIDIRYFQNGMAIYYDNELLGEVQKPEPSYYDKDLSYIFIIRNGEITLRQMNGADTLLELSMDFSGYDLSKVRVSISVNESWQVYNGYFKSVTASSLMSYDSEYTFNAAEDIGKILEDEEPERALIKSQWIVKQKTSVSGWNYDQLSARSNISGFYSSVSTDPQPVPVINVQCGDYSSQVGIYNSQLILRANFPSGNERTTALCFESPADGKIWIHDPEYGLISVLERINGTDTWCINSSDTEVKSIHLAIYKNDEKIWPSDSGEYLFANSTHPSVSSAVTNVSFPELVIDVRQGDMIYFTVRPEHYKVSDRTILSTNPTVISLNPQIDYISVTGEMKFNTGREITEEETDADISGLISEKKAAMNYLEEIRDNHMLYIAVCAAAVLAVGCGVTVTLICVRKRRAKV